MKRSTKRTGSALIIVLLTTMLALTLGATLLIGSQASARMAAKRYNSEQAFRLAEAGLHHAIMSLKAASAYPGETNTAFGPGNFTISITTPASQPSQRVIVSKGTVAYAEGLQASRTISA